jgi:hypothetical protein
LGVEVVHGRDRGMVQFRQSLGFSTKPLAGLLIAETPRRQNFDGDIPSQVLVAGPVDVAHPTGTDFSTMR